ncbi:hypothetical protein OG211_22850 [Streptomyces niveus]|uniref:hypothetical protein n=1 Tax=Streptomyces niveus TaxID=193462 RepID=UPI00343356FC|nr:hypothetical protein OG211_22850 [Streptomyces niveus]
MASLTFMDVAEVDLGKLGTAVADWGKAVASLKTLAGNAKSGLLAKSDGARWSGANATVTQGFVAKTTKEFTDAHAQAESIWKLLSDAHAELLKIQRSMKTAVDVDAPALGVKIEDVGGGAVRWFFPHVRGDTDERTQEQRDAAQALADRIAGLIAHATEIDGSVSRALGKTHGSDPHNFGHKSYSSLDDAQQERAGELAKLGTKMNEKQFAEFNALMKYNAKDSDFSTAFYKGLGGPKKTLEFYAEMSLAGTVGDDKSRLELTKELQRNMGTALASATDPDNKSHLPASWQKEFRELGNQRLELARGGPVSPYGYQVLGGLLRYGNYDARFINPIAEHIVQTHHNDPNRFMSNKPLTAGDLDYGFNPSGKTGAGYDPLTSVMEALGHSPDAAKKFFSDESPTVYNEDGSVNKDKTLDYNYFDELTKKNFEWPPDSLQPVGSGSDEKVTNGGPDALGHALEAATTGHAWDAANPVLRRDEDTIAIMERVIEVYGADSDAQPRDVMKDSLGRMGAAYIDDLNYSTMNFGGWGDDLGRAALFANSSDGSVRTDFGEVASRNFMMVAAGDEEGYKALSSAQQVFTASGLAAFEGDRGSGTTFAENSAKVHGILDESRSHYIREEFKGTEEEKNLLKEQQGEWRKFGVGAGVAGVVGVGSALVVGPAAGVVVATAVPLLMETGGEAVNTAYGNHTLQYLKDNEFKNDPDALRAVQDHELFAEAAAVSPVRTYADAVGMDLEETNDLAKEIESSYRMGKLIVSDAEKVT